MQYRTFTAMKAFVCYGNKTLILRESSKYKDGSNSGRYDVPGGRVEPGQRFDDSLRREIMEETGLTVTLKRPFFVTEWRPQVRGENWHIIATFFIAEADTDKIKLSQDHDDYAWIDPNNYKNYNLIENLHPAFESFLPLKKPSLTSS